MSFKEWSAAHSTPGKGKPEDKSKAAPANDTPAGEPAKKPAGAAPANKP